MTNAVSCAWQPLCLVVAIEASGLKKHWDDAPHDVGLVERVDMMHFGVPARFEVANSPVTSVLNRKRTVAKFSLKSANDSNFSELRGTSVTGAKSRAGFEILLAPTRVWSIQPDCDRPF